MHEASKLDEEREEFGLTEEKTNSIIKSEAPLK